MEKTNEFDPGKAWQIRTDKCRASEEYKTARATVVAAAFKYRGASATLMREKGGWTAIITKEIYRATGHLPEIDLGIFGTCNLVNLILRNEINDLRNEAISARTFQVRTVSNRGRGEPHDVGAPALDIETARGTARRFARTANPATRVEVVCSNGDVLGYYLGADPESWCAVEVA